VTLDDLVRGAHCEEYPVHGGEGSAVTEGRMIPASVAHRVGRIVPPASGVELYRGTDGTAVKLLRPITTRAKKGPARAGPKS
jgi:hypothetical protein